MSARGALLVGRVARPRASPRFLGWEMLGWLTLLMALTAPGQTIGVAVFVDHFVTGLDLSRAEVSSAYLVGTVLGALGLPAVGRAIDRRGVRAVTIVVGLAFGAFLVATGAVVGLVTLTVAFVGIRLLGQGALGLAGQTGVTLWFERRRGLAFGVAMTVSAGLMALAPLAFTVLVDGLGWRLAWVVLGVGIWLTVLPIALLGLVGRPEDVGQRPDGDREPPSAGADAAPAVPSVGVRAALSTPAFWSVTAISVLTAALVTGVTFHHIAIMAARGVGEAEAAAVFLPQALGTVAAGFAFAWMADRVPIRVLLPISGALLAAGLGLGTVVGPGALALLYGLLLGANMGAIRAVAAVALPRWFGTGHIGAIRGVEASVMVAASAVGPLLVAAGFGLAGGYGPVLAVTGVAAALVAGATAVVGAPRVG